MTGRPYSSDAAICAADCCMEPAMTAGLCEAHYLRKWRGMPLTELRKPHPIPAVRLLPRITG